MKTARVLGLLDSQCLTGIEHTSWLLSLAKPSMHECLFMYVHTWLGYCGCRPLMSFIADWLLASLCLLFQNQDKLFVYTDNSPLCAVSSFPMSVVSLLALLTISFTTEVLCDLHHNTMVCKTEKIIATALYGC